MDNYRMQELIWLYEEKMELPDPPHCYTLRCLTETSTWIGTLDRAEQKMVFEYIRYLLKRPGDSTLKAKTSMLLKQFPDWERNLKEAHL